MKHVMVISYYFPPDGGAGTQRVAKFCKYLPSYGWSSTVVTRTVPPNRSFWEPADSSLVQDIAQVKRIIRISPVLSPNSWAKRLPMVDSAHLWLEPAYEAIGSVLAQMRPDAVLVSMSPFDLSFLAMRLKHEHGLPIVLDLRDPWALDGWRLYGTKRRWKRDFALMAEALKSADGVIANTPRARSAILKAIPGTRADSIYVIPNGYDEEDFLQSSLPVSDIKSLDGCFCLVHTGTLHGAALDMYKGFSGWIKRRRHYRSEPIMPSGRTVLHLLQALQILKEQNCTLLQRFRLVLIGQLDSHTRRMCTESSTHDLIHIIDYLPHAESIAWLHRADALFLPLHGLPPGHESLIVPGKTYEYLATGTPILGAVPTGDARELIESSGVGFVADPCDAAQIARRISEMLDLWQKGQLRPAPTDWVKQYERKQLSARLAEMLNCAARLNPVIRIPDIPDAQRLAL